MSITNNVVMNNYEPIAFPMLDVRKLEMPMLPVFTVQQSTQPYLSYNYHMQNDWFKPLANQIKAFSEMISSYTFFPQFKTFEIKPLNFSINVPSFSTQNTTRVSSFTAEQAFETSMKFVFDKEGGFVNNPKDSGGATNMGICKKWYDKVMGKTTLEEFKNLSKSQAKEYYYKEYWIPSGAQKLAKDGKSQLALAVFDAAVHHGVSKAKSLLKSSNGDVSKLNSNRLAYMNNLVSNNSDYAEFSNGWHNRIKDLNEQLSYMA